MSVKTRNFLSFGIILFLFVLLGAYQINQSSSQVKEVKSIRNKTLQTSITADRLKLSVVQVQQFLSDISATRGKDGLNDGKEEAEKYSIMFNQDLNQLKKLNPEDADQLQAISESFRDYYAMGQEMADLYIEEGPVKGNQMMPSFDQTAKDINEKVELYQQTHLREINNSLELIESILSRNKTMIIASVIAFIVFSAIISLILNRSIIAPLKILMRSTKSIAEGDLRDGVLIASKDEFGSLSLSFDQMRQTLSSLVGQVGSMSIFIADSSNELTTGAQEIGKSSEMIAQSMQEVATGSESQMNDSSATSQLATGISKQVNEMAQVFENVSILGKEATDEASLGKTIVETTLTQMTLVQQTVENTERVITSLLDKTEKIGQFVSIITEIAKQTNLLSLNASIEAARAGEHGKGFGVVAAEIRNLADQSNQAAVTIREVIEQVEIESSNAVYSVKEGIQAVSEGMRLAHQTGNAFHDIHESVEHITLRFNEVSSYISEVQFNTETMMNQIRDIALISEQSAANAQSVAAAVEQQNASMQEISSSAESLNLIAEKLKGTVGCFKIADIYE